MGFGSSPKLTAELLRSYRDAALQNANELLQEASLLLSENHLARAYFLAVAAIEECGKALQAHDSQHRNLADPAVSKKLESGTETHSIKINYALTMWAIAGSDPRSGIERAIELTSHLKRGREDSMYSDLRSYPDRAQTPRDVVREEASIDCVRLATDCLSYCRRHVAERAPAQVTAAQDRLFAMKSSRLLALLNTEDFWWFFIAQMESGNRDLAESVQRYERDYIRAGKTFRT